MCNGFPVTHWVMRKRTQTFGVSMMKNTGVFSFPIAVLSAALLLPGLANAQSTMDSEDAANQSDQLATQQAAQMVAARAYLTHKLDARDAKPGAQFTAILSQAVQLKSGA